MDYFQEAQATDLKLEECTCPCCKPVLNRKKSKDKAMLKRRARSRLKQELLAELDTILDKYS